jgi:hypothetical protein
MHVLELIVILVLAVGGFLQTFVVLYPNDTTVIAGVARGTVMKTMKVLYGLMILLAALALVLALL